MRLGPVRKIPLIVWAGKKHSDARRADAGPREGHTPLIAVVWNNWNIAANSVNVAF